MKIKLAFTEEFLGTACNDPKIHENFIAKLAPDAPSREEEVAAVGVAEIVEETKSVLYKENNKPFVWDYQVKGFFKAARSFLRRVEGTRSAKLKAGDKVIIGSIFVFPRKIFFQGQFTVGNCQRPIFIDGLKPRTALAHSETIPAGVWIEFEVKCLDESHEDIVREWLDYGQYHGMGQWRNSGKGRFIWEELG